MTLQMDDIRQTSTAEVFAGDLRACLSRMLSNIGHAFKASALVADRNHWKWRTALTTNIRMRINVCSIICRSEAVSVHKFC